jgi:2-polyprenyl-3-methyl-5-hydroxy-6-metoxy-1,4-benzoquinol methylase
MTIDTRAMYEAAAGDWRRDEPLLLSDFTARQRVLEVLGDVRGLHLWDLGCGEGYVGRRLAALGPRRIDGFDLSDAMVAAAQRQAGELGAERGGPLHYAVANLADPTQLPVGCIQQAVNRSRVRYRKAVPCWNGAEGPAHP